MSVSILDPLLDPLRGTKSETGAGVHREPLKIRCAHCRSVEAAWPVRLGRETDLHICTQCGGLIGQSGARMAICPKCALPRTRDDHRDCPDAKGSLESISGEDFDVRELGNRSLRVVESLYDKVEPAGLGSYVTAVLERIGASSGVRTHFVDLGEPAIAMMADRALILSLGLLATLEDEAQLAFVLSREVELERAGWVWRRFGACWQQTRTWIRRLGWRADQPIEHAIDLSLMVGYGPEAERRADRDALAALVRADYEPRAGFRSLRLLEAASLAGQGGRFLLAADRATWLEQSAEALGRPETGRLNREVYRRAVGGFNVFAR